jgi:hypothetical protein
MSLDMELLEAHGFTILTAYHARHCQQWCCGSSMQKTRTALAIVVDIFTLSIDNPNQLPTSIMVLLYGCLISSKASGFTLQQDNADNLDSSLPIEVTKKIHYERIVEIPYL